MPSYPDLIDRSPFSFVDALCERLAEIMKSFWHESEEAGGKYHTPVVHAQYLPVSLTARAQRDKTKDYPFVLVICTEGAVSDFHPAAVGSEIAAEIYFGAYSSNPDNQGWRLPCAMCWRVMQNLLEDKIAHGYLLSSPLSWRQIHNENPPYYHVKLETKWKGSVPAIETPQDFEGPVLEIKETIKV